MIRRLLGLVLLERSLRTTQAWKLIAEDWEGTARGMAETARRIHNEEMLAMQRAMLDVAVAWRVSMETPEHDIRDDVDQIIRALTDEICKREEHVA